jgi:hypothetical protein
VELQSSGLSDELVVLSLSLMSLKGGRISLSPSAMDSYTPAMFGWTNDDSATFLALDLLQKILSCTPHLILSIIPPNSSKSNRSAESPTNQNSNSRLSECWNCVYVSCSCELSSNE